MAGRPKLAAEAIEQRRHDIERAAAKIFALKGYSGTQIADIAAELGIGHGTVYRYFQDKADVFGAVIRYSIMRVAGALIAEQPNMATLDAYQAQVRRIGDRLFDLVIAEPEITRLLLSLAPAERDAGVLVEQAMDTFAVMTEAYLKNGQARGYLRKNLDTEVAARAINAMILEGARQVLGAEDPVKTKEKWSRTIPQLFLRGARAE